MLSFFSSLSFLYALTIVVLLVYGFIYYRDFSRSRLHRKKFPIAFLVIAIGCFSFLWINMHAPLGLKTFNNLDHHFLRHDGFEVNKEIELGRTDTAHLNNQSFSRFLLKKNGETISHGSTYSEEPFYTSQGDKYRLASVVFPASGHKVSIGIDSLNVSIHTESSNSFELTVNGESFKTTREIKQGLSAWNLFREQPSFINKNYYTHEKLISSLKQLLLLKDDVTKKEAGELKYFFSGKMFTTVQEVKYDERSLKAADLHFNHIVQTGTNIAWGLGFLDNNRNQYRIAGLEGNNFALLNRFPVSYPLLEEEKDEWTEHTVNKFLVSGSQDLLQLPPVFREGFLFQPLNGDNKSGFAPVLLSYRKAKGNQPVELQARWLYKSTGTPGLKDNQLLLADLSGSYSWRFSLNNTYNWKIGNSILGPTAWQGWIFGMLLFFVLVVFLNAMIKPAHQLSWVWQLLSCITLVLLTTRIFLYWRYKSFPPYEGMDIPSIQQLNSFWNFGVIILAGVLLALVFGIDLLKWLSRFVTGRNVTSRKFRVTGMMPGLITKFESSQLLRKTGYKKLFFAAWLLLLLAAGAIAAFSGFDSGVCRHLAIALVVLYFVFVYISYRFSPLVKGTEVSWWTIDTNRFSSLAISNPVKVLLSISLLAVFSFIDIGFSIVFLNFLLFNEAFLCINYAIAGLSAGSRRNAGLFGSLGLFYLLLFILNLVYAPYIFHFLLQLPQQLYLAGYFLFAVLIAANITRVFVKVNRIKWIAGAAMACCLFAAAFLFFPKEKVLSKAGMTKYRIDVQIMPADQAIARAYQDGRTYEPVIRAAQNQWFINTFIAGEHNTAVKEARFRLLPHAPQNKGAKYNAQATDLVTSRFMIAEHGRWSVLLYVLLLMLPGAMLASFYKLYPDFTNRVNNNYPQVTAGFSVLNYLLISALLVILAATGKYIFFGQDLPFGSILSKQSILVPAVFIVFSVWLFSRIPQEYYANRRKVVPGALVFGAVVVLLLFIRPAFNKQKEFGVADLGKSMDAFITQRLQPVWDHFDTSVSTKRLSISQKDRLFSDSLAKWTRAGWPAEDNPFFAREVLNYSRAGFSQHLDGNRLLYLDISSGTPELSMNPNYFRVEPPPHLQQSWKGNVYADSSTYNIAAWNAASGNLVHTRINNYTSERSTLGKGLVVSSKAGSFDQYTGQVFLINQSTAAIEINDAVLKYKLQPGDSLQLTNPYRARITGADIGELMIESAPDAFMKNYFVNGSRFYAYPMENRFTWARNFSESIAADYTADGLSDKNVFVSFDYELMDSLSARVEKILATDTSYKKGAEYGITIADANGRLISMIDFIKGINRPDPNEKAAFHHAVYGDNGYVSQSMLRKLVGNLNLLRLNPGPGSTLKPIVFAAIASQLDLDWETFAAEGFNGKQNYFGGEKVAEYDFEKNNGRITRVTDYLKYSDNYYHSNLMLLGSYPKQETRNLLSQNFSTRKTEPGFQWPYFNYKGSQYFLEDFSHWPGYENGKANFGSDSSFLSIGLLENFSIRTKQSPGVFDRFMSGYDSSIFLNGWKKSGFILPEYSLFDQQGSQVDHRIPYDLFTTSFRGHVKGSSQVMLAPVKMAEAFGKLASQNRNYSLTLDPYGGEQEQASFYVDDKVGYNNYLALVREQIFGGMQQALFAGTAGRLGSMLKKASPYYYYAKTGTTGDNELKTKSKLLVMIISQKDIADPGFSFRDNPFYTIYFTSQNGPAKQHEELQAAIIEIVQQSARFKKHMEPKKTNVIAGR